MTYIHRLIAIAISALVSGMPLHTCCAEPGEAAPSAKVRVAAILPLSGPASTVGQAFRNGITMALEELPPSTRSQMEVIFEDDQFSSKNAVSAFNKIASTSGLDVLINAGSGTGNALSPLAEARHVTFLSISSDAAISRDKNYAFNFWVTPEQESSLAVSEALKRDIRNIARVSTMHEGALAVNKAFDKVNNGRIQISLDELFPPAEVDFRTYITKLRALKGIDAIMVELLPGQCGLFAKQLRQAGLKQDLFAIEVFEDPGEVKASEGALVGQWYINAEEADEQFTSKYMARFPDSTLWGVLNAHDAIMLIGAAIEQGKKPSEIHAFLRDLKDFKGSLGTYSATGDNRFSLPATVKIVTATGFEKLYRGK